MGSIFHEKARLKSYKNLRFFTKKIVLESAWFGPICSENTIIELSFEIEVLFSKKQTHCLGRFFKKRKAIGLENSSNSSKKILF